MTIRENRDRAFVIPIVDHMLEDVRKRVRIDVITF